MPFCASKCRYCNFYSEPMEKGEVRAVIDAMVREMEWYDLSGVDMVYVGGGSPSAIPEEDLVRLLEYIVSECRCKKGADREKRKGRTSFCEFTVEVNPGQVTVEKLRRMRAAGVNRLSMGAQSLDDGELAMLGRGHKAADVLKAMASAREAGFANISIDLIFAIPGQSLESWIRTLERAIRLGAEHISAYALTYEEGTPLCAARERGEVVAADEELDRAMYETAIDTLAAAGYQQYEISNFARPGFECRHNLKYWANDEYIGIGPAAASWYKGARWTNIGCIDGYTAGTQESHDRGRENTEKISDADGFEGRNQIVLRVEEQRPCATDVACETAVLNLRRIRGIELDEYKRRTGFDAMELFGEVIGKHAAAGLLKVEGGRVFLTRDGLPVADAVLCDFAAAE
ncbi:MAG TPA: radical SAM family heme chaperone HemW, partial [Sedimentisphaerales bacterium]|nr:radical SAM family heme chaperone HemW [Sedimentisphaerales bacterium]